MSNCTAILLHVHICNPWDYCMFLDKKASVLTCSGAKWLRRGSTTIPPLLSTRSDGTLVEGTQRYFLANFARRGKVVSWVFHHKSGSLADSSHGCSRYMLISLLNCSPNGRLFLARFSLGIAAKMAPRPLLSWSLEELHPQRGWTNPRWKG